MDLPLRPSAAVLGAFLTYVAACHTPAAEPRRLFEVAEEHRAGAADSAPIEAAAGTAGEPWLVQLSCSYVARPLPDAGAPLVGAARHLFAPGELTPLGVRGELSVGARWLGDAGVVDGAPRADAWRAQQCAALPAGSSLSFSIVPSAPPVDAARPSWGRLEVELARTAGGGELALALHAPGDSSGTPGERLLLDAPLAPGAPPARCFLPAPRTGDPRGGLLLELDVAAFPATPDPQMVRALRRAQAALAPGEPAATRRAAGPSPLEVARSEALRALHDPARRRAALFFLADAQGATLAVDTALLAEDALLDAWIDDCEDALVGPSLGWPLEASALRTLLALEGDEERPLPAELRAALIERAGELASFPDLLGECAEASADLATFEARLASENQAFLSDADPAARVRAFDWLAARGLAPEAYDPLAPRAARRAALAAAEGILR